MPETTFREADGYRIHTSGSTTCPHPELCDMQPDETYEQYVERHANDHGVHVFSRFEDTERNFALNCFYGWDKYVWGNPTMTPYPHWEIHEFISNWEWSEDDLEQRKPKGQRGYRLPPVADRQAGEYRRFKQIELPRECQKTSFAARSYPVFRQLREYLIDGNNSYRVVIRSATSTNSVDSLGIIFSMCARARNIKRLFGVWFGKCPSCREAYQGQDQPEECYACGKEYGKRMAWRRIGLVNDTRGSGATGPNEISLRWLTNSDDVNAIAPYNFKGAGLETETVGWRPDLYIWDDPQTDKNSNTSEKRAKIFERFDDSVRQLEFSGQLLVCNTRKFIDDFAGKISQEPLISLFHSMHRKARWPVNEPDAAPFVLRGYRYFYPVKGNGRPALDEKQLDDYELQMVERKYSAEFLNEPIDPKRALFKREQFKVLDPEDPEDFQRIPPEILYGLNRELASSEVKHLESQRLTIRAYNAIDPSGKEEQSQRGDETAIVGLRVDRYGAVYITYIAGGQWSSSAMWDEVYKSAAYNRPLRINYEMGVDELHARSSYAKWVRDKSEALNIPITMPIEFDHMPKSSKWMRIEQMEQWTKGGRFFILKNAASETVIEKFISQWLNYQATDHDDYPDATSRVLKHLIGQTYRAPEAEAEKQSAISVDEHGIASVPMDVLIKAAGQRRGTAQLWGQGGGR